MPTLTYFVSSRRFTFESSEEGDTRSLFCVARFDSGQGEKEFAILDNGHKVDGATLRGLITIAERDRAAVPRVAATGADIRNTDLVEQGGDHGRGLVYFVRGSKGDEAGDPSDPCIGIQLSVPTDMFRDILNADLERNTVSVSVTTATFGGAIKYGHSPDVIEVEWDIGEKGPIYAESFEIEICPRTVAK